MVQKSRVRIGAVSFLNTKPLIYSLLHPTSLNEEIELSVHVPSRLAELLNADSIDVGLIPIIEYFRVAGQANLRPYRIIPHISISSRGAVRSIQLFSRVPIPEIQSVGLDTSSRSSRALLRIVFAEKYDLHPTFSASPPSIDLQSAETDAVSPHRRCRIEAAWFYAVCLRSWRGVGRVDGIALCLCLLGC